METSKIMRRHTLCKPDAVCLRCFNGQQQLRFPFLVYCEHRETLALIRSAHDSTTFPCAPGQLRGLLARLDGQRTAVQPPTAAAPAAGQAAQQ